MRNGQLIEEGTREAVLYQPQHPYTQYLLSTRKKVNDYFKSVLRGETDA
ncbi:peptide ABC transporter ATPase [Staphylococcus aureus]|nr:peptide ABC transporter ATPase [Staphylococcus aureus]